LEIEKSTADGRIVPRTAWLSFHLPFFRLLCLFAPFALLIVPMMMVHQSIEFLIADFSLNMATTATSLNGSGQWHFLVFIRLSLRLSCSSCLL